MRNSKRLNGSIVYQRRSFNNQVGKTAAKKTKLPTPWKPHRDNGIFNFKSKFLSLHLWPLMAKSVNSVRLTIFKTRTLFWINADSLKGLSFSFQPRYYKQTISTFQWKSGRGKLLDMQELNVTTPIETDVWLTWQRKSLILSVNWFYKQPMTFRLRNEFRKTEFLMTLAVTNEIWVVKDLLTNFEWKVINDLNFMT